jgi:hypothetical protein
MYYKTLLKKGLESNLSQKGLEILSKTGFNQVNDS